MSFLINVILGVNVIEYRQISETRYYCGTLKEMGALLSIFLALNKTLNMLLPTVLTITLCLALLAVILHRRFTPSTVSRSVTSRRKEKQALIQLAAIVITFVIGYSIDYALLIFRLAHEFKIPQNVMVTAYLVPHGILRVCECVNPFLYFLASCDLKEENCRLFNDLKTSCVDKFRGIIHTVRGTAEPAVDQTEGNVKV